MAPEIPFNGGDDPKVTSNLDKFMAAMMAIFVLLMAIMAVFVIGAIIMGLMEAGVINSLIIIVVFIALVAITRKIYQYILKKDFL